MKQVGIRIYIAVMTIHGRVLRLCTPCMALIERLEYGVVYSIWSLPHSPDLMYVAE